MIIFVEGRRAGRAGQAVKNVGSHVIHMQLVLQLSDHILSCHGYDTCPPTNGSEGGPWLEGGFYASGS